jgi:shikimate kinase
VPLWLIGMMGAGKSAVGRRLARRTQARFCDLDHEVEQQAGVRISAIWEQEGEAGFRHREAAALRRVAQETNLIVATGGGVVTDVANVTLMRGSGTVVWLDARPATLARRVGTGSERPLLAGTDTVVRIFDLLNQRRSAYLTAAHYRVLTEGCTIDEVTDQVEELWNGS